MAKPKTTEVLAVELSLANRIVANRKRQVAQLEAALKKARQDLDWAEESKAEAEKAWRASTEK